MSTVLAEIFGEEGCPRGQKLRGDSELRGLVIEKKRVSGSGLGLVVAHGYYYRQKLRKVGSIVVKEGGVVTFDLCGCAVGEVLFSMRNVIFLRWGLLVKFGIRYVCHYYCVMGGSSWKLTVPSFYKIRILFYFCILYFFFCIIYIFLFLFLFWECSVPEF